MKITRQVQDHPETPEASSSRIANNLQSMACQICFEAHIPIAGNWQIGGALCRRTCHGRVCVTCLARHVQVTLAGYYAGIMPVIRCPVCVEPMRMERWLDPLKAVAITSDEARGLSIEYDLLCRRACSFTTPCCGDVDYTHLPYATLYDLRREGSLSLLPSKVTEYRRLVAQFCGHRIEARDVIFFSIDSFGAQAARALMDRTLQRIMDTERRARLMLTYLHMFPKTHTRCHHAAICFRCKRRDHDDECEDLSLAVVNPNKFIVPCPNCGIMITKQGGCDRVLCVCGLPMSWKKAVAQYEENRANGALAVLTNSPLGERIVKDLRDRGRAWTAAYWRDRVRPIY